MDPRPGAEIHHTDPFATPASQRSPLRRLRGRLPAAVTLWTAYEDGVEGAPTSVPAAAGLTVSSTMVVDGAPGRVLGLVDDESEVWAAMRHSGRFAVAVLGPTHRQLADRFAGLFPAPGGLFATGEWVRTGHGPVPADAGGWIGCRLDGHRPFGWGILVEATVEHVEVTGDTPPLVHYRGRYRELPA